MTKLKETYLFVIVVLMGLIGCNNYDSIKQETFHHSTILAISKAHGSHGYEQYKKWILHLDSTIIIYDLYNLSIDSCEKILQIASGLLVSGGPDVNPKLYGEDSMLSVCEIPDNYRDSIEFQSIKIAYSRQLPILGICRGQQILNVYFGGSLINDIPSQHGKTIIHRSDSGKCYHDISIVEHSELYYITKIKNTKVNSSHHQAVKVLADNLIINAYANDSIIESISLKQEVEYPNFFLGVQFHPEQMISTAISDSIGNRFIKAMRINK